jgi:hypothetical protein
MATARVAATDPKIRVDMFKVAAAARAYEHMRQVPPFCGAWHASGHDVSRQVQKKLSRRPGQKQPAKGNDAKDSAEEEVDVWRVNWPEGHGWAKTRKIPKWDFCRVTGPWANRMSSGSVMNYKQWGPDGPLWTL